MFPFVLEAVVRLVGLQRLIKSVYREPFRFIRYTYHLNFPSIGLSVGTSHHSVALNPSSCCHSGPTWPLVRSAGGITAPPLPRPHQARHASPVTRTPSSRRFMILRVESGTLCAQLPLKPMVDVAQMIIRDRGSDIQCSTCQATL